MIITLAGAPASGKGTVGKILAQKLGFQAYSTGQMWREAAAKKGMDLDEFQGYMDANPQEDYKFELLMKEMGERQDNFILDARMGWYMIPHSIKVFLDCNIEEAARRRFAQQLTNRNELPFASLEDAKERLLARSKHEAVRYERNYGIDPWDKRHFDLIVDTTNLTPQQVAEKILESVRTRNLGTQKTISLDKSL